MVPNIKMIIGIVGAILIALLAFQTVRLDRMTKAFNTETANHENTKANFRAAQVLATEMMNRRNQRIETIQKEVTDEISQTYDERIADINARYQRLRDSQRAAPSATSGNNLSSVPDATIEPDGSTRESVPATELTIDERQQAATISARLDELQNWVREQAGIER